MRSSQNDPGPGFYKWAQARTAADRLAGWAYTALLNSRKSENPYPLRGASTILLQDATWGVILSERKKVRNARPLTTAAEHVKEYVAVEKSLGRSLRRAERFIQRVNQRTMATTLAWLTENLGKTIADASGMLVQLAQSNEKVIARYAVTHLASAAVQTAIELERLSFRGETFSLLQSVAQQMPFWATVYSPHPREQRELNAQMKKLGVGCQGGHRVKLARWNNDQNAAGQMALQMGNVLSRIHSDGNLKQALSRRGVVTSASSADKEMASKMGFTGRLVKQTKDVKTATRWEQRLVLQGWSPWVIRLHTLPALDSRSAGDWFEVGWQALGEATSGKLTSIPQLAVLGKTSAGYCDKRQIKMRLKKAFMSRFGRGTVIFGTVTP
jgi:hypothetical protein